MIMGLAARMSKPAYNSFQRQLIAANEDAAAFFRRHLLGRVEPGPRLYLIERGFGFLVEESKWAAGYAPGTWVGLRNHLAGLGYSDDVMLASGLLSTGAKGQMYDTFRDRVTLPVRDAAGHVIAFIARKAPNAPGSSPKYLNTRRTEIFNKGTALFGLSELSTAVPERVVVTEGPFDAIAADLATGGETAALAVCGTALTAEHASTISQLGAKDVVLAFDPDAAGGRAIACAFHHLAGTTDVLAAHLPSRLDPAGALAALGPTVLGQSIKRARPAADEVVDQHFRSWRSDQVGAEATVCLLREVLTDVRRMPKEQVARQVARLAEALPFTPAQITEELVDLDDSKSARTEAPSRLTAPLAPPERKVAQGRCP
ncbi:toprim domain-containing protein [Nocardioides marmorisolisilvae]|uniref:Toprim domain-containing protein n=2 Tax=Nocardioides marmorisolisilvae TaxID=1542737 RepID=A0A3N0DQF0_9ACTN|nr:toprim domain-containing protein [Nocardioides marmorisolisilvae]